MTFNGLEYEREINYLACALLIKNDIDSFSRIPAPYLTGQDREKSLAHFGGDDSRSWIKNPVLVFL